MTSLVYPVIFLFMAPEALLEKQKFRESTFTHLGRMTPPVSSVLEKREKAGLPPVRNVLVWGSGIVQAVEMAGDPRLLGARVVAVDNNDAINERFQTIKAGGRLTWEQVAEVSLNPGRPNTDFLDRERIRNGLSVLKEYGVLANLGVNFDETGMQVDPSVLSRVTFLHANILDALAIFKQSGDTFDLIVDGFTQINVNKKPNTGPSESFQMVAGSLAILAQDGMYVVGDTGLNLPVTLGHFARVSEGRLHVASLTHGVNFGTGLTTSHWVVGGNGEVIWDEEDKKRTEELLAGNPKLSQLEPVREEQAVIETARTAETRMNLVYIAGKAEGGTAWNSKDGYSETLQRVVPNPKDEFSEDLLLPAQKPYLKTG